MPRPETQDHHQRPAAETADEPFEFTHDGETYQLPGRRDIPGSLFRSIRRMNPVDQLYTMLEELGSKEAIAAIDAMPYAVGIRTLEAWAQRAGDLGKSSRSSS